MKRITTILTMLMLVCMGAGAALSSSTIAKSGNVTDTWSISAAMPTDGWTAMSNVPSEVTALGGTPYYKTQDITLSSEGALSITFKYSSGDHRLDILGVDLLDSNDEVVRSDYHSGYTGTYRSHNVYTLDNIASGTYKIRFIIDGATVTSSAGNITVKHINIKTASSYADITHWYFVRMNSNLTNYMYYSSSATTGIAFSGTKANEDKYLWGFVKDVDGVKIYNKAAGSAKAIDDSNPSKLSTDGTSVAFTFSNGSNGSYGYGYADAYFALYRLVSPSSTALSYLNFQSNAIKRYSSDDAGSTFMIDEAPIVEGRIYTIKAYFSGAAYSDRYFTNNDGTLAFNTTASNGVKDYWILTPSGNETYPWKFESGRGDGKFLSPTTGGLSDNGGWVQINNCTTITSSTYYHLYGSYDDASTSNIRFLGTWSPDASEPKTGFANSGSDKGCYAGSHQNGDYTTDYIIEEVSGVNLYTVVSNIDAGGVTYTPSYTGVAEQANGGFYILASTPTASDFTAITVTNYTAGDVTVDATAKTITVNYTANITYTLTDENGEEYEWSASGTFGTVPTLSGCDGYTLSNEAWSEESRTYTADITFPFSVSSNSETNYTYIASWHSSDFYWFVKSSDATTIYVNKGSVPNSNDYTNYQWEIIPSFSNGVFTFKIKSGKTGTYVTSTSTTKSHSGAVTLGSTGTDFKYIQDGSYMRWCLPTTLNNDGSTKLELSTNSNGDGKGDQELGTWTKHDGTAMFTEDASDFATLSSNLTAVCAAYATFKANHTIGTGLGEYNGDSYSDMETAYDKAIAPSSVYTATQLVTDIATLENPSTKLTLNQPSTNGFYRFNIGDNYMCNVADNDNVRTVTETNNDASTIFYLAQGATYNYLVGYADGYGFNYGYCKAVSPGIFNSFTFPESATIGKYLIYSDQGTEDNAYSHRYINVSDSKLAKGQGAWTITEVSTLPVTISTAQYATLYSPVALTIPSGVKAYTGVVSGSYLILSEVATTIPANTPVVLKADPTIDVNTTYNFTITTSDAFSGDNDLAGYPYTITKTDGDLVLGYGTYGIGFYGLNGTTLAGFKSYLPSDKVASARELKMVFDDEVTGIRTIDNGQKTLKNGAFYDLSGRRVQNPQHGMYIVNGRVVVIK